MCKNVIRDKRSAYIEEKGKDAREMVLCQVAMQKIKINADLSSYINTKSRQTDQSLSENNMTTEIHV